MKKLWVWLMLMILSVGAYASTITSDNIDGNSSLTGWTVSSTDYAAYYTGTFKNGTAALRVRYTAYATKTIDTSGYNGISLAFNLAGYSLESGEYVVVQYNSGSGWTEVGRISDGQDDGSYHAFNVSLPSSASDNASLQIRVRIYASSSYDYGYLDDVVVSGTVISSGGTTIISDNIDGNSSLSGWTVSSSTYATYYTGTFKNGTAALRVKYNSYATRSIPTTGYTGIKLAFNLAGYSLESGEYVAVQYNTGSGWTEAGRISDGQDNGSYHAFNVSLPASANNNASLQFRVRIYASSSYDYGYLDDIVVSGTASGPVASSHSGMGAIVYSGGTAFRVWAPNATSVAVAGDFNGWSMTSIPLANEGNGYWSTDVSGATAGQKYKYVINGSTWKKDPYSRKQENSAGASIIYQTGNIPAGIAIPYFQDMIIYELHVGSFAGSSSKGIGTFYGVADKAQYLKDLGVNMVELLPIMEFPGDNSWGYNPSDIFAPESAYGGPEGLKYLVNAFHSKGIGVILDIVYNHLGPSDLDLWQFDGWSQNGGGGIYFYNDWRGETPWGNTRPDYGRPEVRQFLRDNALYWLQEFNVDGVRWDSTINIRKHNYTDDLPDGWSLMQWINNEINSVKPSAISIAEDLQKDPWMTYDTGSGGAGFDAQWDAGFVHPVKTAIETAWDSDRNMNDVAGALAVHYGDRTRQIIYVCSHDEVGNGQQRPPSAIDNSNPGSWLAQKRSTLGTGVLMTAPGIPMIFQGEEFLQPGYFDMDVHNNFLDWDLVNTHAGILQMYKDLINIHKNYAALRGNNINVFHVDNNNKLIAYHRWDGTQNIVIIANFANKKWTGNYQIGWPVWKTGHAIFNSDWNGYSSDFSNYGGWDLNPVSGGMDGMNQKVNISIAPYSVEIYDLY